jgi:plastocyanin
MDLRARISVLISGLVLTAFTTVGLIRAAVAEGPRAHIVTIEGMKFSPDVVRIHAGDRVVFRNTDLFPHTATTKNGNVFDSGLIKPGESWTVQPSVNQPIHYVCRYHPSMTGQIVVAGSP